VDAFQRGCHSVYFKVQVFGSNGNNQNCIHKEIRSRITILPNFFVWMWNFRDECLVLRGMKWQAEENCIMSSSIISSLHQILGKLKQEG
jgi:hypothetical protein